MTFIAEGCGQGRPYSFIFDVNLYVCLFLYVSLMLNALVAWITSLSTVLAAQ